MRSYVKKAVLALAVSSVLPAGIAAQGAVTLDHVDGAVGGDYILSGRQVVFHLRLTNSTGDTVVAARNGFRVYSETGAQWIPRLYADTSIGAPPWTIDSTYYGVWVDPVGTPLQWYSGNITTSMFGWIYVTSVSDHDADPNTPDEFGQGIDTVIFTAGDLFGRPGVPDGLSEIAWTISIDHIGPDNIGKTICLDSSTFWPYAGYSTWVWYGPGGQQVHPEWDGPHCFTITDQCCWGMRGNVNLDWQDEIDISDLTALVGWMFKSGSAPPCMLEADVDGNDSHDVGDVTYLVAYMFRNGPEPAACP